MALPLILQALAGGLLGQYGANSLNDWMAPSNPRASLLGNLPQVSESVGPPTQQGEAAAPEVRPGSGLLGMYPASAAPLLQNLSFDNLQKLAVGKLLPQEAEKPQIVEGADGFKYWATGPNAGQRVLPGVTASPKEDKTFEHIAKLRGEFTQASKGFVDTTDSFTRINESARDPSGAGDVALLYNFMKMLDPASVVRESEFMVAQNTAGFDQRIQSMYEKLKSGKSLTPDQRADMYNRAKRLYEAASKNQKRLVGRYDDLAKEYGFPASQVTYDYSLPTNRWMEPPTPPNLGLLPNSQGIMPPSDPRNAPQRGRPLPPGADPLGRVGSE